MSDSGEEKPLPPSERKLDDARRKGQVPHSKDLLGLSVIAALFWLYSNWPKIYDHLLAILSLVGSSYNGDFATRANMVIEATVKLSLVIIVPPLAIVVVMGIALNILDTKGLVFSFEPVSMDFNKVNPVEGFKRIFGVKGLVEVSITLVKALIYATVGYFLIKGHIRDLSRAQLCGPSCAIGAFEIIILPILTAVAVIIIISALEDMFVSRWLFKRDMRMSITEMRREQKDIYGDPAIRRVRREQRNQIAASAQPMGASNASVMIYGNGYAIGIRYIAGETAAPVVVSKSAGIEAEQTLQSAASGGVTLHTDADLAGRLYKSAPNGQFIPSAFFDDVASALVKAGVL